MAVVVVRGINVGGRNKVPMAELRTLAAEAGLEGAATYVQSGNVVGVTTGTPDRLAETMAAGLRDRLRTEVAVLARTAAQWETAIAENPLAGVDDDPRRLHVAFLDRVPAAEAVRRLVDRAASGAFGADRLVVVGDRAYLHTPGGYAASKLGNSFLEKALGVVATTRNWRTTLALGAMAAQAAREACLDAGSGRDGHAVIAAPGGSSGRKTMPVRGLGQK